MALRGGFADTREVSLSLQKLQKEVREEIAPIAVKRGAAVLVRGIKSITPVRKGGSKKNRSPGRLRRSIRSKVFKNTPGRAARLISTKDPIAHLVEFGHKLVVGGTLKGSGGKTRTARNRFRTGKGRVIGFVSSRPDSTKGFFRKGIEISEKKVQEAMFKSIKKQLNA